MRDRPGVFVFAGGVACLLASTALGFYLAHEAQAGVSPQDYNQYLSEDARMDGVYIRADQTILSNVNALMWMVFALGTCLTLVGLRMMTRPNLDDRPLPSIGPLRELFENPE